jgi:RHS repeat-associated protein
MAMPGRTLSLAKGYRFGFNGKENDNDVKGEGNQQDYGMRIYDPRLGRFLSTDPITDEYPELTPYQFASNTPIQAIDLDGLEGFVATGMPMGSSGHGHGMIVTPEMANRIDPGIKSLIADFIPWVGTAKGGHEAWTGYDMGTGQKLAWWERGLNVIPYVKPIRKLFKGTKAINAVDDLKDVNKISNSISDVNKTVNNLTNAAEIANKTSNQTATVSKVYKSAKLNAIASEYGDDIAKVMDEAGKEGPNLLRTALIGSNKGLNVAWQAHHVLPAELLGRSKILREAVRQGFDFNGVANGIALDLARHNGSHSNYTQMALQMLETNFNNLRRKRNFKEIAEITANQLKDKIQSTTGKINDIQ